ncbi:MAG: hypothetical protein DI533_09455 [Cereibacter sphaeroides]|uniref:Uncharacterized protein n=1 Tax=Cereibacter sphaeroides TaxID=1063 RepID=A0A2W5TX49_CERSP|nr:MAG: hypothetical protein DI533_09455 [Cereibacter sphaeroides]
MTDIANATPLFARRLRLRLPGFPTLGIGASLPAMSRLFGDALCMAYVDPYSSSRRREADIPEEDMEGRDPGW